MYNNFSLCVFAISHMSTNHSTLKQRLSLLQHLYRYDEELLLYDFGKLKNVMVLLQFCLWEMTTMKQWTFLTILTFFDELIKRRLIIITGQWILLHCQLIYQANQDISTKENSQHPLIWNEKQMNSTFSLILTLTLTKMMHWGIVGKLIEMWVLLIVKDHVS